MTGPFPSWPAHGRDELDAVRAVLESGRTNQWTGSDVERFEAALARQIEAPHVLAVSSGTTALETALRAVELGAGDEVLVPARSFIATASAVMTVGADVRCADIDDLSGNVSVETLEAARTPRTRCVVVMHHGGWPCDMPAIIRWAKAHGLLVVEDCAQAMGGRIDGIHVGRFGDAAAFSFCQDKIITTGGEGGCVVVSSEQQYERAWSWRDHGKSRLSKAEAGASFRWMVESVGSNVRMTGMQAAIGRAQLAKLRLWRGQRRANADVLRARLGAIEGIDVPWPDDRCDHAWYVLHAHVDPAVRDEALGRLREDGWPVRSGVCPELHREAVFGDLEHAPTPVAKAWGQRSLMLPIHPTAEADDMHRLADAVIAAVAEVGGGTPGRTAMAPARQPRDSIERLIGRPPVEPVESLLSRPVRDRVVLVTGAGGSIGAALCEQIARAGARRLVLLDRNEFGLYESDRRLGDSVERSVVLGDVRDEQRCAEMMSREDVQTVFHAAAYKHVPLVESNPIEAVENNVFGTRSMLAAAARARAEQFVLVSSDKAVRPCSVMGASKRLSEMLVQADASSMRTCIVRFGNVLESSGSVVPLFREQIAAGGPVTITDAAMVRYFMTITEAAQLVIQAGGLAHDGEVLVLDMGDPVSIEALARLMIRLEGRTIRTEDQPDGDIELRYIGPRPGEKIEEELLIGNDAIPTEHARIAVATEPAPDAGDLAIMLSRIQDAIEQADAKRLRELVRLNDGGVWSSVSGS